MCSQPLTASWIYLDVDMAIEERAMAGTRCQHNPRVLPRAILTTDDLPKSALTP